MKGMQKIRRGSGFLGVLSYLLDHDSPEILAGTICIGSANEMTREFALLSQIRSDIKKPVWHESLRLPAGEHITNKEWNLIVSDFMNLMGFDESAQYIVVKHNHSEGEHVHIVANRIMPDGSVYLGKNENLIATKIISDLEKTYKLTVTKGPDANGTGTKSDRSKLKKNEIEKSVRTGKPTIRLILQDLIDQALKGRPDTRDFINRLHAAGVTTLPNIAENGRMNGFSFELENVAFSGSKLGKKYAWSALKKAIDYSDKHNNYLKKIRQKNKEISSEKITTSAGKLSESIESIVVENQDAGRAREKARRTKSQDVELSRTNRETSEQIFKNGFAYTSITVHSDTHTNNNNYDGIKTMKHKKKSFEELNNIDHVISGNTLESPSGDELIELQKQYLKTLELAFTRNGNQYFYRDTNRLAFYETETKIIGKGLYKDDGTLNKTAVKAMTQAAQIKFGNEFKSSGSDAFLRESWLAAAMLACNDTGFVADAAALDELKFRMLVHKDKYGKDVHLHETIEKLLNQHELDKKNIISMSEPAISSGLFGNTLQKSSSDELKFHVDVSSLVNNYKKAQNKENEGNNQEKTSIKSLIDNYKKSQP